MRRVSDSLPLLELKIGKIVKGTSKGCDKLGGVRSVGERSPDGDFW